MSLFKQLFKKTLITERTNDVPNGYTDVPGPRATFQIHDVVIVRGSGKNLKEMLANFKAQNPIKNLSKFNTVGTIIGYKRGTMSAKFAVRFADGSVGIFNTAYLLGPFTSINTATQATSYETNESIPSELFSSYIKRDYIIPVNSDIENNFKGLLVNENYNFIWLDKPLILNHSDPKSSVKLAILAYRKDIENYNIDNSFEHNGFKLSGKSPSPEFFKNAYFFFKLYDNFTGKFVSTKSLETSSRIYTNEWSSGSTGYCLMLPLLRTKAYYGDSVSNAIKSKSYKNLAQNLTIGVSKQFFKVSKKITKTFDDLIKLKDIKTFDELFELKYIPILNSDGTKTINLSPKDELEIDLKEFTKKFDITKYKINGDVRITLKDKICVAPQFVNGSLTIDCSKFSIDNFLKLSDTKIEKNFQIVGASEIFSLEGCPNHIKGDLVIASSLTNLHHIPTQIDGNLKINGILNSFEGGDECIIKNTMVIPYYHRDGNFKNLNGLPTAAHYDIGVDQEKIDNYFKFKKLKTKLPELDGIF